MGSWEVAAKQAIERVSNARWLEPDAALEALAPAALRWIEERLDEFTSALNFYSNKSAFEVPKVRYERSLSRACSLWESAWSGPTEERSSPYVLPLWQLASSDMKTAPRLYSVFAEELLRASMQALERSTAFLSCVPVNGPSHGQVLLARHLAFLEARAQEEEWHSPWEPLLSLWERGAWPMLLPNNEVLVYVPVREDSGVVVADPEESKRDPLVFRAEFLGRTQTLPVEGTLRVLGLGPVPPVRGGVSVRARLVRVHPKPAFQFVLGREERIGRGDDVELRLYDRSVELRHARINCSEDRFVLTDTGGGTLRNGSSVSEAVLSHGDLLEFGRVRCRFENL